MNTTVSTIGHSNHPFDVFVNLLLENQIQALVDIRRFPSSRTFPHFNQDRLSTALADNGIAYHWLESLGGRRETTGANSPNLGLRNPSFRNYADYMLTNKFQEAIENLLDVAQRQPTAMMCAESVFWRCHRRLVSDYLLATGIQVRHIFPDGDVKPHNLTDGAKFSAGGVIYPEALPLFDAQG